MTRKRAKYEVTPQTTNSIFAPPAGAKQDSNATAQSLRIRKVAKSAKTRFIDHVQLETQRLEVVVSILLTTVTAQGHTIGADCAKRAVMGSTSIQLRMCARAEETRTRSDACHVKMMQRLSAKRGGIWVRRAMGDRQASHFEIGSAGVLM
jgi:hypothetical protein